MSVDRDELKEKILKMGESSKDANKNRYKNLDEWQKRFEALRSIASLDEDIKKTPWAGASNVGIPLDATVIYTIQAREIRAMFGVDPPISLRPADLPYAPVLQRMINWQLWEEMQGFMDMLLISQQKLIDGDAIVKTIFDKDEIFFDDDVYLYLNENNEPYISQNTGAPLEATGKDASPIADPLKGMIYLPKPAQMTRNRVIYMGPKMLQIPLKRFIVPTDADHPDPSRLEGCIHEFWKPYGWVHQKAKQNPEMFDREEVDDLRKDKDKERAMDEDKKEQTLGIDLKTKTKMFKFWEWHGRYEDDDGKQQELIALLCPDEKKLIGHVSNRFFYKTKRRQFVHYTAFPSAGRFYGRGVPEMLRGIRSMLDAIINQSLDRDAVDSNSPILYDQNNSGFDPSEHKFGPGRSWGLRDISKVSRLPNMQSESSTMQRETMLFELVQRLFGVSDYATGQGGKRGMANPKGQGAIMALINEGNIRFDVLIKTLQEWSNPELARQVFQHNVLNMPQILAEKDINKPKEIFGPIAKLSQEELMQNFEYVFKGNTGTINPIAEQQKVQEFAGFMLKSKNPFIVDDPDVMHDLTVEMANAYNMRGIKIKTVEQFRAMSVKSPMEADAQKKKALQEHIKQLAGAGQEQPEMVNQ